MTVYRLIAPEWLRNKGVTPVLEGVFTWEQVLNYNKQGYNCYAVPNHPKDYLGDKPLAGDDIDTFEFVFVDMDLKDGVYASKDAFIERVAQDDVPTPTSIVDSGNGVHVYWRVTDLDAMSYLRLCKRMMRLLKTDEKVGQIFQLMRCPGTLNTKVEGKFIPCEDLFTDLEITYTAEELDRMLPAISQDDEAKCQQHFARTYRTDKDTVKVDDKLPVKFGQLLHKSAEVKAIWQGETDDRSKNDFRLGHILFANGFTKQEAMSVLVNSAKALARAPIHRINYAENIIDKIWTYEIEGAVEAVKKGLSSSVAEILAKSAEDLKGTRFPCHVAVDNTKHGFRLGQVIGLVAGSGVGKTAFALNMFRWFVENNPNYDHFFIPLEQPAHEIADRWATMCGEDTSLHSKVHVLSNYDENGSFRHLSLDEIKDYILSWEKETGKKVGCVVIDHIGALKKKGAKDENQDLITICHAMKAFAIETDTLLVMQSQTSREKAGIGDLELNKDAAYGTLFFESYCDYLITMWQPLKRCHDNPECPTVTAYKFCKIRHKKAKQDIIKEDVRYYMYFDSEREILRPMTDVEMNRFNFWNKTATNLRKQDRKTDVLEYKSAPTTTVEVKPSEPVTGARQVIRH